MSDGDSISDAPFMSDEYLNDLFDRIGARVGDDRFLIKVDEEPKVPIRQGDTHRDVNNRMALYKQFDMP